MLQTFKDRLKAKLKASGVNLSAKRIDTLVDRLHSKFPDLTEEADHDAKLDELNDVQPFSEIAAFDDYQRAKEAKEKKEKQQSSGQQQSNEGQQQQNEQQQQADESPTDKLLKELLAKVSKLESDKVQGSIRQKATEKLKDVPVKFWDKRSLPEKEEELETFITDVTSDYDTFKQDLVNQGLAIQTKPAGASGASGGSKPTDAEIDKIMSKINI